MEHRHTGNWDKLHSRMMRGQGVAGAMILVFQAFIVVGLFFS